MHNTIYCSDNAGPILSPVLCISYIMITIGYTWWQYRACEQCYAQIYTSHTIPILSPMLFYTMVRPKNRVYIPPYTPAMGSRKWRIYIHENMNYTI